MPLPEPLKRYLHSAHVKQDEVYVFKRPIAPEKEVNTNKQIMKSGREQNLIVSTSRCCPPPPLGLATSPRPSST